MSVEFDKASRKIISKPIGILGKPSYIVEQEVNLLNNHSVAKSKDIMSTNKLNTPDNRRDATSTFPALHSNRQNPLMAQSLPFIYFSFKPASYS